MKFFRYKQVARLNFSGIDDELNDVDSSYYNTKQKLFDNDEINTKLLRFRINNLRDIKLSQNAKIVLESANISTVEDSSLNIKHNSNISLRFKNLSDSNCYNSSNDNNSYPIILAHCFQSIQETGVTVNLINFERGVNFLNSSPDKLYNFNIPSNFTNNTVFEFEIIYEMNAGYNIVLADDN